MRVLNFGAGVQSTTILMMTLLGEFEKPDYVVFCDSGWEPQEVYHHLEWCEEQAATHGVMIHRVTAGNLRTDTMNRTWSGSLPLFVRDGLGKIGMLQRQCTTDYKVEPLTKFVRRTVLGLSHGQHIPKGAHVERWLGISTDERQRARHATERWVTTRWPLIERNMSRIDCLKWMQSHGFPLPPKSSCVGCPFHNDGYWRNLKQNAPDDWLTAVEFDRFLRDGDGLRSNKDGVLVGTPFLHRSCKPLDEVDLSETGQGDMFVEECMGLCGT